LNFHDLYVLIGYVANIGLGLGRTPKA